jgi:phage terminase large subunit
MRLWQHLQAGGNRAMAVWHRRAGKDEICSHHAACSAMKRTGNYWHCLPEFLQGRKAIWTVPQLALAATLRNLAPQE